MSSSTLTRQFRSYPSLKASHLEARVKLPHTGLMGESARKVIGYIRVSTEEQRKEGISLEAQQDRIANYCKQCNCDLIEMYQDDSSGRTLDRPGLQMALKRMVDTGAQLMAISIDRISRTPADWIYLLDTYFGQGKSYNFLAFDCAGIDPRTSTGRMFLLTRAVFAEGELNQTGERTRGVLAKLKADGVSIGGLPYGKAYSRQLDDKGRRIVVDVPEQIETIGRIKKLYKEGIAIKAITAICQKENRPTLKGTPWNHTLVRSILKREGLLTIRHYDRTDASRDQSTVIKRISELRANSLSFSQIGAQLTREKLMPATGSRWHAQTVMTLWNSVSTYDQSKAIELAAGLYKSGYSLRKIGQELSLRGITPQRGGTWHASQVRNLLMLAKIGNAA